MSETTLTIRLETEEDRSRVATLLARTYRADGVKAIEQAGELRQQEGDKASLAYVAEQAGEIVACAIYSPVTVDAKPVSAVLLASLGVDTKRPIDVTSFLDDTLSKVKSGGHRYVLMRGDINEFAEKGFVKSQEIGLDFGKADEGDWLVKDLESTDKVDLSGKVDIPDFLK